VTQNIDGLHARADSSRLLELHGSLWRTRCSNCDRPPFADRSEPEAAPRCDRCGGVLRPDVVWFGERVDLDAEWQTRRFIKAADRAHERRVFLAAGTSGTVSPASDVVRYAADFGAETWPVNLDEAGNAGSFDHLVRGRPRRCCPPCWEPEQPRARVMALRSPLGAPGVTSGKCGLALPRGDIPLSRGLGPRHHMSRSFC